MSLKCPHCNKNAMSVSKRLWLGPARRVACVSCGKFVSVSWASVIGLIPILAGFYISIALDNVEMGIGILAIGTMLIFFMQSALDLEKR